MLKWLQLVIVGCDYNMDNGYYSTEEIKEDSMNKVQVRNGILHALFFMALVGSICFIVTFRGSSAPGIQPQTQYETVENWEMILADGTRQSISLPYTVNTAEWKSVAIETRLADDIRDGMYLCIPIIGDITVSVDGTERLCFSSEENQLPGGIVKGVLFYCPLYESDAGAAARILFQLDKEICKELQPIYIGDAMGAFEYYFHTKGVYFGGIIALFVISLMLTVAAVVISIKEKRVAEIIYISVGILMVSLWLLADNSLFQLVFHVYYVDGVASFMLSMLMPYPFFVYMDSVQEGRYHKVHTVIKCVILVNFTIFMVLHFTGTADFLTCLAPMNLVIGLLIVTELVLIGIDLVRHRTAHYRIMLCGLLTFILSTLAELLLLNLVENRVDGVWILTGLFVLLFSALWQQLRDSRFLQAQVDAKTRQLDEMTLNTIVTVANSVDAKDKYTSGHSAMVARVAKDIAQELGWSAKEADTLYYVALLHDIGKIVVPDNILNKPGRLTEEEFAVVKKHPAKGNEILKGMNMLEHVQEGVYYHHERWDGTGYPTGIAGEEIPMCARIICIADSFDAMNRDRVYRPHLSMDEIIAEFERCSGSQFDPALADVFIRMLKNGYRLQEETPEITGNMSDEYRLLNKVVSGLQNMAETDSLTGLYNTTYLKTAGNRLLKENEAGCFIMIDLDDFKHINDNYGHMVGDLVLKELSNAIKETFKRQSDILGRIGGDEFALFLSGNMSRKNIAGRIEMMTEKYLENPKLAEYKEALGLSIGIAMAPHDGRTTEELYKQADKALYFIKENGKRGYRFFSEEEPENAEQGVSHQSVRADMQQIKKMIEKGNANQKGALSVEYQNFKQIYSYLLRYVERNKNDVQILLFTLYSPNGEYPDISNLARAMNCLNHAVIESLRRVDVGTEYSSNQYIVILADTNLTNGSVVAERVMTCFRRLYAEQDMSVTYEIENIGAEKSAK